MKTFGFGRAIQQQRDHQKQQARNKQVANEFKLPTNRGYLLGLKYALFVLFGAASASIQFYCQRIAFPLLFSLLLASGPRTIHYNHGILFGRGLRA